MIFIDSERRACAVFSRLHTHKVQWVNMNNLRILTVVANVVATLALIAAIWLISFKPPEAG